MATAEAHRAMANIGVYTEYYLGFDLEIVYQFHDFGHLFSPYRLLNNKALIY
jgi:hypothetical protein